MHLFRFFVASSAFAMGDVLAPYDDAPLAETRSIDEIYQAALDEGGSVTLWHGGDEAYQRNSLKTAFEARFPGVTINVTVNLSKSPTPLLLFLAVIADAGGHSMTDSTSITKTRASPHPLPT